MLDSLLITAALMGWAGGPHCLAMCGAPCAAIAQAGQPRGGATLAWFQVGRVIGYGLLGALAGAAFQGLGWLTLYSAVLRPVWSLFHAFAFTLGLWLLWRAEMPLWAQTLGRATWQRILLPTDERSTLKPTDTLWTYAANDTAHLRRIGSRRDGVSGGGARGGVGDRRQSPRATARGGTSKRVRSRLRRLPSHGRRSCNKPRCLGGGTASNGQGGTASNGQGGTASNGQGGNTAGAGNGTFNATTGQYTSASNGTPDPPSSVPNALRIIVIGDGSLWSDYRPLLDDLAPGMAEIISQQGREERFYMFHDNDL